ncbi:MAG TPA: tripartite tricarboxylate transporter substrate binding protein [Burkholderiales bacterium]
MRILLALVVVCVHSLAQAQDAWPAKPVRIIVPSSPGGGTDVYARLLAQALGDSLKQQFVVENRPGASGNIGAAVAAKAAPDGYTILVSANPALSVNPSLYRNLPYNAEKDLAPVTRGVIAPMVVAVNPSVKASSLADLVKLSKSGERIAYGSAGTGSPTFLGIKMFEEKAGAQFTHVPYKGVGAGYADLLGGQIQFMMPDVASAISHIRAGKLRAIAVSQPTPLLPGVPTFTQAGYPVEVFTSFSVVAPAGTPEPILARLAGEISRAMRSGPIAEKLEQQALLPVFDTPAEFAASLKKERDGWADFIRRNNIQPSD